ncbi:DUF2147 domain-containing protein [Aquirufa rosea]|uniref:DUF2147 domain-containing protein n=1 Tax=Aquirufa rosea TaxID=2509241 RepID=A0A4V1M5M8_9BACT|nr:DUF2147 domain-containing protein [Aquirufa rosea]RXK50951.1 DUF2147 domain-containing protein [Aquirufa rosea]
MKNAILLLLFNCLFVTISLAEPPSDVILGDWISQQKDGKITIYKQGDKFYGKISWSKTPGKKDTKNPNEALKSRDLLGAVILKDFSFTGSAWENGTIYDPHSGKTYDCILKIKDNNKTLDIRGFVGVAMFGRTSTWTRP